jgi:alpha-galactosidase
MQNHRTTQKIVVIGVGSASFGPTILATLIRNEALHGSHLALVDLNSKALAVATEVAGRMNEEWDAGMTISSSTERTDVLPGASHVVVSIEVGRREELWQLDWEIPLRHGLRQPYAENGGPGGLAHALRQIPPHLAIAADMERLCPQAWMIIFSNPLPRIVRAIRKYSKINVVGKCHQIEVGYALCAALLHRQFDITLPDNLVLHSDPGNVGVVRTLAEVGRHHLTITSTGLNHFIWLLDIHDRHTSTDLYPELKKAIEWAPPTLEPLALELFRLFGRLPIAGDTHLVEYLPWLHDPLTKPHEIFLTPLYDWRGNENVREVLNNMMQAMADGKLPVAGLREAPSEGATELTAALGGRGQYIDETVNIPNNGAIQGLPDETIVEVPAVVDSNGIRALQLGHLPPPILELCRREAALVEFVVDAAAQGDRRLALQALLMDPMINDIGRAKAILDDYLTTFAQYLPQFDSG